MFWMAVGVMGWSIPKGGEPKKAPLVLPKVKFCRLNGLILS